LEVFKTFSSRVSSDRSYYMVREIVLAVSEDMSGLVGFDETGKGCQGDKVEA
jgi:hypothetical protein